MELSCPWEKVRNIGQQGTITQEKLDSVPGTGLKGFGAAVEGLHGELNQFLHGGQPLGCGGQGLEDVGLGGPLGPPLSVALARLSSALSHPSA